MIDVDGYLSSAQIYLYLHELNSNINIFPLFHEHKLHGLDDEEVMQILTISEPSLLIIPDASGSEEQYKQLVDLGYEILCIDHHKTKPSKYAITINNQHSNDVNKQGAGANVVFQFLRALDNEFNVRFANHYVDLCAIGNIGDVMDMANPYNRTLNYYGLSHITNPFIRVLCDKFVKGDLTPHNIAWSIVPKFNAVIRSDDDVLKEDLFWSLVDGNFLGEHNLQEVADRCDKCHQKQVRLVTKIANLFEPQINDNDKVIIIESNDSIMPDSYTGLIAGKISGDYNKPCVVLKGDNIGSMRSPIAMKTIFNKCKGVDWCNGHDNAAGIKVNDINELKTYCQTIDISNDVVYNSIYSGTLDNIPSWFFGYFNKYDDLFGKGIEKPLFHIKGIKINSKDISEIGKNKTTIKFKYKGIDFVKFFANQTLKDSLFMNNKKELEIEILGELDMNEWNGHSKPQVVIDKIEAKENKIRLEDLW